ncbi:MAG: adenosylhomocysteinase [Armatimonadota bacterium]|nr:adenosylhomocysteinase [Armatimonadota bacterium]
MQFDIADRSLAAEGKLRIEWADQQMPVLAQIRERFVQERPLEGQRLGACLHVTTETANLMRTLKAGGAEVAVCASNPLSTQDDVAASLVEDYEVPVFAICGEDRDTYYQHVHAVLDTEPTITMDDGADLVSTVHSERTELIDTIRGGTEETTTGVIRLRSMAATGELRYPIVAVNDAMTKHLFDNRFGTGQSTIDGIIRATNILLAGRNVVVCGYGMCGRGVAMRARGMGAKVTICEVDELRALEALLEGYQVLPVAEAAAMGDIFVTVTGNTSVIRGEHMEVMKSGAILCNSGHFDVEIDLEDLRSMATGRRQVRPSLEEFEMPDGRRLYLLGEGRLVNLAAAEGHPASVMDMSFANQSLCSEFIATSGGKLRREVHSVPEHIDRRVAELKLASMNIEIDELTPEQKEYLSSWRQGT